MIALIIFTFGELSSPDIFCGYLVAHTMDQWNVFHWLWIWKNHQHDSIDHLFCLVSLAALTFFSAIWLHTQWINEMFSTDCGYGKTTSMILLINFLFGEFSSPHVCFVLTELAQMQRRCYAMCIVVQQWKLQIRQQTVQKVVKSQMLAMFIFYCQLHMNVITTENVMLHLHGEITIKTCFFKKPTRFCNFA